MMKFFKFLIICFLVTLQVFESGAKDETLVEGKSGIGLKLAVVNLKDVARKSKAGQSIDDQLEEINNKSKKDLLELEDSIKKMDSTTKTSADGRKVEDLQVILYDMTKEKRYQIQVAYRSAIEVLEEEIRKVVKEIADENVYSLVVISDIVVYGTSECPDITKEAIRRLDNKVSKIEVDIAKKEQADRRLDDKVSKIKVDIAKKEPAER